LANLSRSLGKIFFIVLKSEVIYTYKHTYILGTNRRHETSTRAEIGTNFSTPNRWKHDINGLQAEHVVCILVVTTLGMSVLIDSRLILHKIH